MKRYRAEVTVMPKEGVLDTQGKAVEKTLAGGGYTGVEEVRVGKFIRVIVDADDLASAETKVREITEDLLINDLVESYTMRAEEIL